MQKLHKQILGLMTVISFFIITKNNDSYCYEKESCKKDSVSNIIEIIEKTFTLFPCEIIKVEKKFKKDVQIWKLNVVTLQGGTMKLEYSVIENSLIQIEADEGPYDYDLTAIPETVSFMNAKKIAEEYANQKVLKWNLKKSKDIWEYNFWMFTKSGKAQVRVNGISGELILKKGKR